MYIEFRSARLRSQCENLSEGTKAWGRDTAARVVQRINELKAAQSVADLSYLPPARCHRLKGSRKGQYAVNVGYRGRLVFEPLDALKEFMGLSGPVRERGVKILGVEDYHD